MGLEDQVVFIKVNGLDAYLTAKNGGGEEIMIKKTDSPGDNETFVLTNDRIKTKSGYYLNKVDGGCLGAEETETTDSSVVFSSDRIVVKSGYSPLLDKFVKSGKGGSELCLTRFQSNVNLLFEDVPEGNNIRAVFSKEIAP